MSQKIIETSRLIIRLFMLDDLSAIHRILDQTFGDGSKVDDKTALEFGLFWVIDSSYQRQGYATEAAQAMIEYAFTQLRLKRVIATTEYSNAASQGVMRKLGMKITRNPLPDPPWLQTVGILENTTQRGQATTKKKSARKDAETQRFAKFFSALPLRLRGFACKFLLFSQRFDF